VYLVLIRRVSAEKKVSSLYPYLEMGLFARTTACYTILHYSVNIYPPNSSLGDCDVHNLQNWDTFSSKFINATFCYFVGKAYVIVVECKSLS